MATDSQNRPRRTRRWLAVGGLLLGLVATGAIVALLRTPEETELGRPLTSQLPPELLRFLSTAESVELLLLDSSRREGEEVDESSDVARRPALAGPATLNAAQHRQLIDI